MGRSRSRSRSPRRRRSRSPRADRFGSDTDRKISTTLFVGNLPFKFTEDDLTEMFGGKSKVKNVKIGQNKRTGSSHGYAFIAFFERKDAEEAMEKYNRQELQGRELRIDWDVGIDKKRELQSRRRDRFQPYRRRRYSRSPPRRGRSRSPRRYRRSRSGSRSPRRRRSYTPRSRSRSYSRSPSPRRRRASPSPNKEGNNGTSKGSPSRGSPERKRTPSPDSKK